MFHWQVILQVKLSDTVCFYSDPYLNIGRFKTERFLRDVGPSWHDSITQLLQLHICDVNMLFTTSKRCSSGLRSGDCGGPGSAVNSLSSSGHKLELIWPLWHSVLTCWKPPAVDDTLWLQQDGHQWFSGRPWHLKDAQLVPRGPKYDKKISPTALPELLTPSFQVVCTKFWS